jgi:hypothetical protein
MNAHPPQKLYKALGQALLHASRRIINARPGVGGVIDHASGAAGSYPPATGEGVSEGLDCMRANAEHLG